MTNSIYEKLAASKKYAALCPDTLRRVAEDCARRYKKPKEAEKAARETLHGITGAFMRPEELKRAEERLKAGDMEGALEMHASTRERKPLGPFYEALFARTGRPGRVLDVACGLNPIYLAAMGVAVTGVDIAGGQIEMMNRWASAGGYPLEARLGDALCPDFLPEGPFDLTLAMKLLPVLENQKKGAAAALIESLPSEKAAVTFPTRTLSGRGVGMERHYSQWFEGLLPEMWAIFDRYVQNDELIYLIQRNGGGTEHGEAVCGGHAHR